MSGISTSITLTDRMSRTFSNINSWITTTISSCRNFENAASEVGDGIEESARAQRQFNSTVEACESPMQNLVDKVKSMAKAYLGLQGAKWLINTADDMATIKARLDLMNDGTQTTDDLFKKVYQSAQNSRSSIEAMADVVGRFGNNAKDAFSSNDEVIRFAELVQKQMKIAGASTQESANAMLQLSQALGSGVLRGDELNSIFEQAPNLIQNIADYLNVPIGKIREMASNGELSASVVKNAIMSAADDIDAKFAKIPQTWGDLAQSLFNMFKMALTPVFDAITAIANSSVVQGIVSAFQPLLQIIQTVGGALGSIVTYILNCQAVVSIISGIASAFQLVANVVSNVFNVISTHINTIKAKVLEIASPIATVITWLQQTISTVVGWINSHLEMIQMMLVALAGGIATVIALISAYGIAWVIANAGQLSAIALTWAQVAAQTVLNGVTALWNMICAANPLVLIVIAAIAVIASLIYVIMDVIKKLFGVENTAKSAFGVLVGWVYVAISVFKNFGLLVANVCLGIKNVFLALVSNLKTAWDKMCYFLDSKFYGFAAGVIEKIAEIANSINDLLSIFGTSIDVSGITNMASNLKTMAEDAKAAGDALSFEDVGAKFKEGLDTFKYDNLSDAYNRGAAVGDGFSDKLKSGVESLTKDPTSGTGLGDMPQASTSFPQVDLGGRAGDVGKDVKGTKNNTKDISKKLDKSNEDLKYLRDIAEREAINRFTTAEIHVDMGGITNMVNSDRDLDGMMDYITTSLEEQMYAVAEGSYE